MTCTFKSIFKKIILLLPVLFVLSCGGENCIEADDFGEYEVDMLEVPAVSGLCDWTSYGVTGAGSGSTIIQDCLNTRPTDEFNTISYNVKPQVIGCLSFLDCANNSTCVDAYNETGSPSLNTGFENTMPIFSCSGTCIKDLVDAEIMANPTRQREEILNPIIKSALISGYDACEADCKKICRDNNASGSVFEPEWIPNNHPLETNGTYGIEMSPSRKINMSAKGKISLVESAEEYIEWASNTALPQSTGIDLKAEDVLGFDLGGHWCDCPEGATNCTISDKCGTGVKIGEFFEGDIYNVTAEVMDNRMEFLRRGVVLLRKHPEGYRTDTVGNPVGVPVEPDFNAWSCNYATSYNSDDPRQGISCEADYSNNLGIINAGASTTESEKSHYIELSEEIYGVEDSVNKTIGGYVVPTPNLSYLTNPFADVVCERVGESVACKVGNEDFANSPNGFIIGNQNRAETNFGMNINQAVELAFNIFDDPTSTDVRECLVNVSFDGNPVVTDFRVSSNAGWTMLSDANGVILLNELSTVSNNLGDKNLTVEVLSAPNSDNAIGCEQGFAVRIFRSNELVVAKSGFVSFKTVLGAGITGSDNCVVKFDIINPKVSLDDGFYEYEKSGQKTITVPVDDTANWSESVFIRKGQVIRFDSSSWETVAGNIIEPVLWQSSGASKQCGRGMLVKIQERPALLCKGRAEEEVLDSACNPIRDSNTGEITGCKQSPSDFCIGQANVCPFGCFDTGTERVGPSCDEIYSASHLTGEIFNQHSITKATCQQCQAEIEALESNLDKVRTLAEMPQCYNLENYLGRVANINELADQAKDLSNITEYGLLSEKNYFLGARKLRSDFVESNNFASVENFALSTVFKMSKEAIPYYYSNMNMSAISYDARMDFMVLDGETFDYTESSSPYSNNVGAYLAKMFPNNFLANGRQLAVVIARKDWDRQINSAGFKGWVVMYENDNLVEGSPYIFNDVGELRKNENYNSSIISFGSSEGNKEFFEPLHYISSNDNPEDFRLFFKIMDNEPEQGNIDKYANNSGIYKIQMKAMRDTNLLLEQNTNTILRRVMQPIIETLDGKTVLVSQNKQCSRRGLNLPNNKCYTETGEECYDGEGCYLSCEAENEDCKIVKQIFLTWDICDTNASVCYTHDGQLCQVGDDQCYKVSNLTGSALSTQYTLGTVFRVIKRIDDNQLCTADLNCYTQSALECKVSKDDIDCYLSCDYSSLADKQNIKECVYINDNSGLVRGFYKNIISSTFYQTILHVALIMMVTFYGFGYLLGLTEMKQGEMLTRLLKVGFIYLLVGEDGWYIYERYVVKFFKDGVDYLVFAIAGAFDESNTIESLFRESNFYDKSVLFTGIDRNLTLIFSPQVQAKILGLFFVNIFGWIYTFLIYFSILTYIFAVANAVLLYITAQIMISVLLTLGPLFFVFLLFDKTKGMFDKWINNLISFSLQQIFLLTVFSFFNILIYDILKFVLSYPVCWAPIFTFKFPIVGHIQLLQFWKISGAYSGADPQVAGANFPGLFHVLIIYLIARIMKEFIVFITEVAGGLIDRDAMRITSLSSGISNFVSSQYQSKIKEPLIKQAQAVGATIKREGLGIRTKEEVKEVHEADKQLRKIKTGSERQISKEWKEWQLDNKASLEAMTTKDRRKAEGKKKGEIARKVYAEKGLKGAKLETLVSEAEHGASWLSRAKSSPKGVLRSNIATKYTATNPLEAGLNAILLNPWNVVSRGVRRGIGNWQARRSASKRKEKEEASASEQQEVVRPLARPRAEQYQVGEPPVQMEERQEDTVPKASPPPPPPEGGDTAPGENE